MITRTLTLLALCAVAVTAAAQDIPTARVVLPWSDFKDLYERGMAPQEPPQLAPRDAAISRAVYEGSVEGEATVFRARVRVDILKEEGWTTVPLLPTTVALRQARVGGKDAPIYLEGGWYRYITDRPGPVVIDMEFAVTTWESSGQVGFAFQLAPSGGTEVSLAVPSSEDLEFTVANAQQVTEEVRGDRRVLHALLPASGNLSVTWELQAPEVAPDQQVARAYAEHQALVGVGEGLLQCRSTVNYSILHAGMDAFSLDLPADVTILEVEGRGLRDWAVQEVDGRKRIDVDLNFEAIGPYSLHVEYERALPDGDGAVEIPDLTIHDVERVKGWVGIDARSNLEIASGEVEGVAVVDVRELPAAILGQTDWPVLLGFKYRGEAYRVPLVLRQHDDVDMLVTIIDQIAATSVMTPDGRRMTQVTYAMRNNRAQFLRQDLPDGAVPWSTFVGGRAVKPARADDGRLLVPLARSQTSGGELARFAVELVYVEDGTPPDRGGQGTFDAVLPTADVPATACAWTVYVPYEAKVPKNAFEGTMREVDWFTAIDLGGITAEQATHQVQQQAAAQFNGEAVAAGVQPVRVTLPLDGRAYYFEKLLVFDEILSVKFPYKGLK